jgi:hypothetical protein
VSRRYAAKSGRATSIVSFEVLIVSFETSIVTPETSIVSFEVSIVSFEVSFVSAETSIVSFETSFVTSEVSIVSFEVSIVSFEVSIVSLETSFVMAAIAPVRFVALELTNRHKRSGEPPTRDPFGGGTAPLYVWLRVERLLPLQPLTPPQRSKRRMGPATQPSCPNISNFSD